MPIAFERRAAFVEALRRAEIGKGPNIPTLELIAQINAIRDQVANEAINAPPPAHAEAVAKGVQMPVVKLPMAGTTAEKICQLVLAGKTKEEVIKLAETNEANYYATTRKWRAKGFLPAADDAGDTAAKPSGTSAGKASERMAEAVKLYNAGDDEQAVASKMNTTTAAVKLMIAGARNAGITVRAEGGEPVKARISVKKLEVAIGEKKPRKKWTRKAAATPPADQNQAEPFTHEERLLVHELLQERIVHLANNIGDEFGDLDETVDHLRAARRLDNKLRQAMPVEA